MPNLRLMKKIKGNGVDGNVAKWIFSWLNGRRQHMVINGKSSIWGNVITGVLLGSVLGPLLFLIYINNIDIDLCSSYVNLITIQKMAMH